jgi:DNA-binding MarR family transcriptional regulator
MIMPEAKAKRSRALKPARKVQPAPLTVSIPSLIHASRDQQFGEMIALMHAMFGRLQTIRRFLAKALGLSSSEFAIVITLQRNPESGLRIRSIAEELHVAAANVTATVTKLERSGWVIKGPDRQDSRAVSIQLSRKAKEKMIAFASMLHSVNDIWFEGTTSPEFNAVVTLFRRLIDQYPPAIEAAKSLDRRAKHDRLS